MANLIDQNNNLLLKFILHPDKDSQDWITYEILICSNDNEHRTLLELSQEGLYLEACHEPEIETIFYGVLKVINEEKPDFFFTPIDEKDFRLDINKINNDLFSVGVYSNYFKIFDNYEWNNKAQLGVKFLAKKNDLLNFIRQLKNEYEKIKPEQKLLTKGH